MAGIMLHWYGDETEDHNCISNRAFDMENAPQQYAHGTDSPMFYHCKLCQTSFPTIERFNAHNSFHEGDGQRNVAATDENAQSNSDQICYRCKICGAAYCDLEVFENHVKIHSGRTLLNNNTVKGTLARKKSKNFQTAEKNANNQKGIDAVNTFEDLTIDARASSAKAFTGIATSDPQLNRSRIQCGEATQLYNLSQDIGNSENSSFSCISYKPQEPISGSGDDMWQSEFYIDATDLAQNYSPFYPEDSLTNVGIPCVEATESQSNSIAPSSEKAESIRPMEKISTQIQNKKAVHSRVCKEVPAYVLEEKPHQCVDCGARFSRESGLQEHIRTHTGEKPFKCQFCNAAFVQRGNLQRHIRVHTKKKPFKCYYCPAHFYTQGNLQNHTRIHTGETPYKCDYCDNAFAQLATLRKHIRVHTGERQHKCPHCQLAFAEKGNLTEHLHCHQSVKPFACGICGALFSSKRTLQYHGIVHSTEKQFECPHCKQAFKHRTTLHKHITNIHPRA